MNGTDRYLGVDWLAVCAELKKLRDDSGMSQAEVGRRSGVGKSTVNRIEKQKHRPKLENIEALAVKAFGLSLSAFFARIEPSTSLDLLKLSESVKIRDAPQAQPKAVSDGGSLSATDDALARLRQALLAFGAAVTGIAGALPDTPQSGPLSKTGTDEAQTGDGPAGSR